MRQGGRRRCRLSDRFRKPTKARLNPKIATTAAKITVRGREGAMFRWWQAAAVFAVVGPADAAELSLQRIMLSSGGVGYFEYEAVVDGYATLSLDMPLDQVDDILKSLVVYDDGGTASEVTLP